MSAPPPLDTEANRKRRHMFAQLDAIHSRRRQSTLYDNDHNMMGYSHTIKFPPLLSSTGHVAPPTPNTRRLPPVFQEHRQHAAAIHRACAGLRDTLQLLDADFGRGAERSALAAFIAGVHGGAERTSGSAAAAAAGAFVIGAGGALGTSSSGHSTHVRKDRTESHERGTLTSEGSVESRYQEDVARARTAAADEGFEEDQSVCDYSAEPEVPHFSPDSTLRDEVISMELSLRKIIEGVGQMSSIESRDSGNPWWQSAMLTRDMKTHAIRVNYHARHALQWNYRARERFLLNAVAMNEHSEKCRKDLIYLREQQALFVERTNLCVHAQAEATEEMAALQETLREVKGTRAELQRALVARAHECGLMPQCIDDAARAELLLLLQEVTWPEMLKQDVDRVSAWIRDRPISVDV